MNKKDSLLKSRITEAQAYMLLQYKTTTQDTALVIQFYTKKSRAVLEHKKHIWKGRPIDGQIQVG